MQAVKDVSFKVERGEVLGIVGESGSGKSVTALSLLGLLPYPKAFHSSNSSVLLQGRELIGDKKYSKFAEIKLLLFSKSRCLL